MKIVNLKLNMPTVCEALAILDHEILVCKTQKRKCIKIIHGYGSTGKGGKIRKAVRKNLEKNSKIKFYIPGENFSIFNENTRKAFLNCSKLREDEDLEKSNNGVTFIIL